jgi:hypothetical protein
MSWTPPLRPRFAMGLSQGKTTIILSICRWWWWNVSTIFFTAFSSRFPDPVGKTFNSSTNSYSCRRNGGVSFRSGACFPPLCMRGATNDAGVSNYPLLVPPDFQARIPFADRYPSNVSEYVCVSPRSCVWLWNCWNGVIYDHPMNM